MEYKIRRKNSSNEVENDKINPYEEFIDQIGLNAGHEDKSQAAYSLKYIKIPRRVMMDVAKEWRVTQIFSLMWLKLLGRDVDLNHSTDDEKIGGGSGSTDLIIHASKALFTIVIIFGMVLLPYSVYLLWQTTRVENLPTLEAAATFVYGQTATIEYATLQSAGTYVYQQTATLRTTLPTLPTLSPSITSIPSTSKSKITDVLTPTPTSFSTSSHPPNSNLP